jgi:hypothetical protein
MMCSSIRFESGRPRLLTNKAWVPLQVLQPVTDILDLLQRPSGSGDVAQGAQHEPARGMPTAADGALLDRGQVLFAEQERFERAGDRISIEPG